MFTVAVEKRYTCHFSNLVRSKKRLLELQLNLPPPWKKIRVKILLILYPSHCSFLNSKEWSIEIHILVANILLGFVAIFYHPGKTISELKQFYMKEKAKLVSPSCALKDFPHGAKVKDEFWLYFP